MSPPPVIEHADPARAALRQLARFMRASALGATDEVLVGRPLGAHPATPPDLGVTPVSGIPPGGLTMTETVVLAQFGVNDPTLNDDHHAAIEAVARLLVDDPAVAIRFVSGRASQTGPDDFNEQLSEQRAQQVWSALEQRLVDAGGSSATSRLGDPDAEPQPGHKRLAVLGQAHPILDRPAVEEALNRSVTIELVRTLELPEPEPPDLDRPGVSTEWHLDLTVSAGLTLPTPLVASVATTYGTGTLRNETTGESRPCRMSSLGAALGLKPPAGVDWFKPDTWGNLSTADQFRTMLQPLGLGGVSGSLWSAEQAGKLTTKPATFDDFDLTVGMIAKGELGVAVGAELGVMLFPMLWGETMPWALIANVSGGHVFSAEVSLSPCVIWLP